MGLCGYAAPNCTLWAEGHDYSLYHADPDIAGIGVVSAFVATSFVTVAIAHISLLLGIVRGYEYNEIDKWVFAQLQTVPSLRRNEKRIQFWQPIMESLMLSLSDQQLLVGLAILVTGFLKHCSISVYHFAVVSDLAWFSSNTHMTTLNVLQVYLADRPTLRNWRVALMLSTFVMLIATITLEGHILWFDSWNSPAQCLFDDLGGNIGGGPQQWMIANIVLLVYGYTSAVLRLTKSEKMDSLFYDRPVSKMEQTRTSFGKTVSPEQVKKLQLQQLENANSAGQELQEASKETDRTEEIQDDTNTENDSEPPIASPRRIDTEAGGRGQSM
ncbi:MAG: hypothetical protein Q9222_002079 [Ikaeria aurantiellina]